MSTPIDLIGEKTYFVISTISNMISISLITKNCRIYRYILFACFFNFLYISMNVDGNSSINKNKTLQGV